MGCISTRDAFLTSYRWYYAANTCLKQDTRKWGVRWLEINKWVISQGSEGVRHRAGNLGLGWGWCGYIYIYMLSYFLHIKDASEWHSSIWQRKTGSF